MSTFVVQDGVAHLRLIHTGLTTDGRVEVLAGLDAGELVVISPPPQLMDAHAVLTSAPPAPGGTR
jgi:hypothetical protein